MSGVYAVTSVQMATGGFNWLTGSFSLMLVGPGYTPNYASDYTLGSIPATSLLLASPVALTGTSVSSGACSANAVTWPYLSLTSPVVGVLIVQNTGTVPAPVWRLVCYIDQGIGLGKRPTGGPFGVVFSSQGVFQP